MHREESDTFAELFVRRADDGIFAYNTITTRTYICQITTNYRTGLHNNFSI